VGLATQCAAWLDGCSLGSNDLTQLLGGVDRDAVGFSFLFAERHEASTTMRAERIHSAHQAGPKVGICGQAPRADPACAAFVVSAGLAFVSLNLDRVIAVNRRVAHTAAKL
jgi:pyruvate,water dikinase